MSPAVALGNYRARYGYRLTAKLIAEPLVRIRYLKEAAQEARKRRDCFHTDDPRYDFGDAEWVEARDEFLAEVARQRRWRMPDNITHVNRTEQYDGMMASV